ncbi:MAG: GGDEF domain-containing protein, partial [Wenzhouxiangella sp.]
GRTAGARKAVVVFMALGCIYMVNYVGHLPYWVFPTVVANFLLVGWRFGLAVNTLLIAVVMLGVPLQDGLVDSLSFMTAVTMVALFSMFFVIYTNFHRRRLNALVERDPLTDALNRRALSADLEEALAGAGKVGQDHALVVMDLDDFKQINDLYGHEVGDQVLVSLSQRVMQFIRRGDRFYRLGGEEFVVLLSHTDREGAEVALDKIRVELREALEMEDGPVTVSIGVAVGQPGETWSQWLSRADLAMYEAKRLGKDRVVFAD